MPGPSTAAWSTAAELLIRMPRSVAIPAYASLRPGRKGKILLKPRSTPWRPRRWATQLQREAGWRPWVGLRQAQFGPVLPVVAPPLSIAGKLLSAERL
ncbi:hypothetical protein CT3_26430 [Comamonas terrigena NBRC 13299]|uniref:hypothetical protein n=1 Tax=Comamonas terrigena TaxID=32013 RepID=UPI0008295DB7|nr:hypothetical protein [Comamonas terrigena]BBL25188.1 hypothetical protein CT3_26430 [Comamonas terrigena NBRC 13299]